MSAAEEPRLRAAVSVSGPGSLSWQALPPFITDTLTIRACGVDAAREFARQVDTGTVADRIRQPLLVVDGGLDAIPGATNGERLARTAPRGEYLLVPDGDHLLGNVRWKWLPRTADWLADHLLAAQPVDAVSGDS